MSFAARETSRSLGAPIALFLFQYGDAPTDVYCYTSAEEAVGYNGNQYAPIPIDDDAVVSSGSLDKAALEIRLSKDIEINGLFTIWPPSRSVTLRIYHGHAGEAEFKALWSGRIISYKVEGDIATFTGEPISTALRRSGLRRHYQYGCPHVLYGDQCRADKGSATVSVQAAGARSPFAELPAGWSGSQDPSKYIGGLAQWVGTDQRHQIRSILRIESMTEILLSGDCSTLAAGTSISLSLGCDHQYEGDCASLHNNVNNFGGDPWIPLKNPIGLVNNFN